jgi:hypothetical protein
MKTFRKELLIKGMPKTVECIEIDNQVYNVFEGLARIACFEEEWHEDVRDPKRVIAELRNAPCKADIFMFWQRFPNTTPLYNYYCEFEPIGILPIQTYDQWFKNILNAKARNKVRKAEKLGVQVVETEFDDEFVHGITKIFNETPIRQGKRFWHYGKNFDTVKEQFSKYLFREILIGAYLRNEMIGFMMLPVTKDYAVTGQFLSMIAHRDKAPNNALLARAVRLCEEKKIPYLIYPNWGSGSFAEFKRHCGFTRVLVPRYYVPLNSRGHMVLRLGLHRGLKEALPEPLREKLKVLRRTWLEHTAK